MSKFKSFLSSTLLMIGVLVGVALPTHFSVALDFGVSLANLGLPSFSFLMPNYSLNLYAVTAPNRYTIHFNGNGNTTGSMADMNMLYDEMQNLTPNSFTKDGFAFIGWSTSAGGDVVYSDQTGVINLTTEDRGEITLYAQWTNAVPYTIEYYQENIAGTGYDLIETGDTYGAPGTGIVLTGNTYTGFTLQTGAEVNIVSGGTVPYYYTRNTYNLIIQDRDETLVDTGIKYGADIPLPPDPVWTGNHFDGWSPPDDKMPAEDIVITSTWTYGIHTITFDTDGGTAIAPITKNYGEAIETPPAPTKEGYDFVGWNPGLPTTMPYDDITVTAIWKEKPKGSGWSGGGGGGGGSKPRTGDQQQDQQQGSGDTTLPEEDYHGTKDGQNPQLTGKVIERPDLEVFMAYAWAYRKGIISTRRNDSDPDGYVTRGDMAEMVVKFTENVLGKEVPPTPTRCKWGDLITEWKSVETITYAEKSCALGVMGIRMENFMPNKVLDRAEFGTILSRLLWGDKYDVVDASITNPYYTRHLNALNEAGIMKQIDNPEMRKELRKRAWLMMMRVKR